MSAINISLKKISFQLILGQLFAILGLSLFVYSLKGEAGAVSVLGGGFAYFLPNLLYVLRIFAKNNVQKAQFFVITLFVGETVKLIFSGVLFVVIVKYLMLDPLYMMIGFATAIISFWVLTAKALAKVGGAI